MVLHHCLLHLFLLLLLPPPLHHLFLLLFSLFPRLFLPLRTAHNHNHNHNCNHNHNHNFHLSLSQLRCSISPSLLVLLLRLSPLRLLLLQHFPHLPLLRHPPPRLCPWSYPTLRLPLPRPLRMPRPTRSPPSTWQRSRTTLQSPERVRRRTAKAAARAFLERGMSLWYAQRTSEHSR